MLHIYIYIYDISNLRVNDLTLILLTWRKWWANNASKYQMGFNSGFKGLNILAIILIRYLQLQVTVVTDMSSWRQTTDKMTRYVVWRLYNAEDIFITSKRCNLFPAWLKLHIPAVTAPSTYCNITKRLILSHSSFTHCLWFSNKELCFSYQNYPVVFCNGEGMNSVFMYRVSH